MKNGKLAAVEIETVPFAEEVDGVDLAMVRQVIKQQTEAQQLAEHARQAMFRAQGADQFVTNYFREKYHIEGNFTVDDKGKIIRLPTAELVG